MKPKHVQDWEKVQKLYRLSPFSKNYRNPEQAESDLLDKWFASTWEITFMDKVITGKLDTINTGSDVVFTFKLEPEIDGIFEITGWYERFRYVEEV